MGHVSDPGPYYAMADIYLDSYPTRAVTSVLEAALLGLPVHTIEDMPEDDPMHIFQADSPGLIGLPRVRTPEQYSVGLRRLVADPDLRARLGAAARESVRRVHDGPEWADALERLYTQARGVPACSLEEIPQRIEDPGYAAMLQAYTPSQTQSPHPGTTVAALGDLFDPEMQADLVAAFHRDADVPLVVRVAPGWERDTDWTGRLLALASAHPRLCVSMPFVPGDDVQGTASTALVTGLLAAIGQSPESCGDIRVEGHAPRGLPRFVEGELPPSSTVLDWLATVLSSPCWDAPVPVG